MRSFKNILPAALAAVAVAAPVDEERSTETTPTVYLAGDSTMALGGGGTGTQGTHYISHFVLCIPLTISQAGASTSPTPSKA